MKFHIGVNFKTTNKFTQTGNVNKFKRFSDVTNTFSNVEKDSFHIHFITLFNAIRYGRINYYETTHPF